MKLAPTFLRRGPWRQMRDVDILHTLAVATLACALSGGLLSLAYFVFALHIARRAPITAPRGRVVLLFGKRLVDGAADADYLRRIERARRLLDDRSSDCVVLLGGSDASGISEASVARAQLFRDGVPVGIDILVEDHSIDTWENLRNARALLDSRLNAGVVLVSSRYHLARCLVLARLLGLDGVACAAEPELRLSAKLCGRLVLESGYIAWVDISARWAALIGHRRLLAQLHGMVA